MYYYKIEKHKLTTGCLSFKNSTESHFSKQPIKSNSDKITMLSTQMHPGKVYIFTLTVSKTGRTPASVTQTVSVTSNLILFSKAGIITLKLIFLFSSCAAS